jgi:cytochrome c oxidase subunit 1
MSDTHELSFWKKYLFSTDHKVIGMQYTTVGLIMALVGGFLAYAFRYNLAYPGEDIPLFGNMGPADYNSFVTMHGMIMFFWVAMPILLAGLGNLLLPLQIGTDDMAFPTVNMISFWIFFLSTVVLLASFFVPGGAFGGGWTLYPPLSVDGYVNRSPEFFSALFSGGSLLILAVALEFTSMLMGGINFIVTTVNKRAPGMTPMRMPIFTWLVNLASLDFMFSVGPLVAGAFMMLFDRTLGTGFYDAYRGGDPLLFQHLFWFFGHPEVYVILLPALGVIGEIITVFSRKPLFGYRLVVYMSAISAVLAVVVWAHHQFIAGIDPGMATFFSIGTILISIPFAAVFLSYMSTLWKGKIQFTVPMLWALSFLGTFLIGGLTGIFLGSDAFDIYAHDSYFIVAHFHYTVIPVAIIATFAAIYHWFPKFTGRMLNETLGKLHFWLTLIFFNITIFPLFFLGLAGQHRRINDYSAFESLMQDPYPDLRIISTIGVICLLLSQIIVIYNVIISLRRGIEAPSNPWDANTLEWQAASPPPHGNFSPYPTVYRGAYEYSFPGRESDAYPQNEE